VSIAATPVFAQQRPTVPPGQVKKLHGAPGGSHLVDTAGAAVDLPVRSLGSWLDDARVLPVGQSWLSVSFSRWSTPIASGSDTPAVDVSVGLTPRLQASISAPYFRASDQSGTRIGGIGDMSIATKIQLRDPTAHRVGLALGPTLEVATSRVPGTRRINWLLPLNIEWHHDRSRVYGSAGYFARGVVSTAGAIERAITDRFIVTGALTHAYSIDRNALDDEIGLSRRRVDVSGNVSYVISPAFAVYGSFGRTLSRLDADATRALASVGVSMNVRNARTR
jgi:hypothetical protein